MQATNYHSTKPRMMQLRSRKNKLPVFSRAFSRPHPCASSFGPQRAQRPLSTGAAAEGRQGRRREKTLKLFFYRHLGMAGGTMAAARPGAPRARRRRCGPAKWPVVGAGSGNIAYSPRRRVVLYLLPSAPPGGCRANPGPAPRQGRNRDQEAAMKGFLFLVTFVLLVVVIVLGVVSAL